MRIALGLIQWQVIELGCGIGKGEEVKWKVWKTARRSLRDAAQSESSDQSEFCQFFAAFFVFLSD